MTDQNSKTIKEGEVVKVESPAGETYAEAKKGATTVTLPSTPPVVATPAYLLQMAVEQGKDLAYVEKLMDMQDRWEEKNAEKSFNQAMSDFSMNLPTIEKTVYVEHFDGYHADLGLMATAVREAMAPHGLSFSWETTQGDQVTVSCVIKHRDGHKHAVTLSASPDTSGSKNAIQAIGSAVKYLERYTLEAATGIVATSSDDDGQATGSAVELVSDDQALEMEAFVKENNINKDATLKWIKTRTGEASYASVPADQFDKVMHALRNKAQQRSPGEDG